MTKRRSGQMFIATLALGLTFFSIPVLSQQKSAALRANDTELLMLGTAGGPPLRRDRSEPATLLIVDGRPYLIDCGIGTIRRLVEAGIPSETIGTIFFTHLHPDHDLGLVDVMANDYFHLDLASDARKINIYGPPETSELVQAAFQYISTPFEVFAAEKPGFQLGRPNHGLTSPFVAHEIEGEGVVYRDDKIQITAVENSHYALMPAQFRTHFKSYSYRIQTPHGVVVFTGDTGPSDAVVKLAKGADVLVAEVEESLDELRGFIDQMAARNHWPPARKQEFAAHMEKEHLTVDSLGELASKAEVQSVLFYHYDPQDKAEQQARVAAMKKYFPGPVLAPMDLDRYCLSKGEAQSEKAKFESCGQNTADQK
ncbi:MAG TPA: MBL fold metallo-hydrolase [Candidatus Sulfotelmatobacter sp.]|nr:MBL fold metallo-hydrolase [Candidatus Sulfotelmatobacter sp.]